jgi:hypothetical protein
MVKHQRAERHVDGGIRERQAVSRSFHKVCGDALCGRFAAGVGDHFRRLLNAVRRAGRANPFRRFNKQSSCAAADIQDSVAWMEFRQTKRAPTELPLAAKRYRARQPVVSTRMPKHMAVVGFVPGVTGRSAVLIPAAARDEPGNPADDYRMRQRQSDDEWQPPDGDMDGEQVERNSRAESEKAQRRSARKPAGLCGFIVSGQVVHMMFLSIW